jgi:hypothetical protein
MKTKTQIATQIKFFSAYAGQEYFYNRGFGQRKGISGDYNTIFHIERGAKLILNPLSKIMDKDVSFIAKCIFDYYSDLPTPDFKGQYFERSNNDVNIYLGDHSVNIHFTSGTISFVNDGKDFLAVPVDCYDLLRDSGYLIRTIYKSPRELIDMGFVVYPNMFDANPIPITP